MPQRQTAFILFVLLCSGLPAFAFFKSEGSQLTASFNRFASSRGFHSTMFLSKTDPGPAGKGKSFTYMLNECVGALGTANNGVDLSDLFINATGCRTEQKSAAVVHLLIFVADQCSTPQERSNAEKEMLAAFQTIADVNQKQTIELGICKIRMQHSDVVGFIALVQ
jgi:hypothetical protein